VLGATRTCATNTGMNKPVAPAEFQIIIKKRNTPLENSFAVVSLT